MRTRSDSKPRKVVAYVRVSTEEQAAEGHSLAAQEARIRAYAVAADFELAEVVTDAGESAKNLNRPGLQRILESVRRREISQVVVLKLDRLTRSVRDLGELLELFERSGAVLTSVTEALDGATASGRLMLNLLASVSQWERETIGERTATVLSDRRRNGQVYCAQVPFGYRRANETLIPVQAEQDALAEMRRMHDAGKTYREIGEMLDARGIKPRGKRWYPASVRAVLSSKMARAG